MSILRRNETVAYLVSRERMEAIVETLELLSNPAAMREMEDVACGAYNGSPKAHPSHAASPSIRAA
jgi:hypothetical protein